MAKNVNNCEVSFKQGTKKISINFTEGEDKLLSYTTDMSKFGEIENTPAKIALSLANFFLTCLNQAFKQESLSNEETTSDVGNTPSE